MSLLVKFSLAIFAITATFTSVEAQGDFAWGEEVGGNFTYFNKLEARNGWLFCYGNFFDVQTIGGYTLNSANGNTFRAKINRATGQIEEVAQSPVVGYAVSDTEVVQLIRINATQYYLKCVLHNGIVKWCHEMNVTGNGEINLQDVGRDELGNFFVLASFNVNSLSYGTLPMMSTEMKGLFVWKLLAGGFHSWFHKLDVLGSKGGCLSTFGNGEVITAHYLNTNIMLTRISNATGVLWTKTLQTNQSAPENIKLERTLANNFYIGGTFRHTLSVQPGLLLTSSGERDAFLVKFNSNGTALWAKSFGGSDDDVLNDFSADSGENIYCVGVFENSINIDGMTMEDGFPNAFTFPAFVALFKSNGALVSAAVPKAATAASNQTQFVRVIATDSAAYIAGRAFGPTSFGTLSLGQNMLGMYYPFVLKFQSSGLVDTNTPNSVGTDEPSMKIWPNPSQGVFQVSVSTKNSADCRYSLYDLNGRKILEQTGKPQTSFALNLLPGMYLLNVSFGTQSLTQNVVIR